MKSKIGLLLVVVIVMIGLLVSTAPSATAQQVIKWKMQSHLPPTHSQQEKALPLFVKKVAQMSQGRLQIELYPVGALMQVSEIFDGVSKGVIQIARAWPGYFSGIEPAFVILSGLPFGLKTMEENLYLIKNLGWEDLGREIMAKHGVHLLNLGLSCPYGELSSKVPIRKTADYKGLKIRGYGMYNRLFEKFGARGITMAPGEIYTGLATGTIDATIWGTPKLHHDLKLHEVCKYWITPPLASFITNMDIVNAKAWAALSDDLKGILEVAAYEAMTKYPIYTTFEDAGSLNDMIKNYGVQVCTLPPEELAKMQAAAMTLWDEAALKDAYSARAIKIIKDFMTLKGYVK